MKHSLKQIKKYFSLRYKEVKLRVLLFFYNKRLKVILGAGNTKLSTWVSTDYPIIDVVKHRTLEQYFRADSVDAFIAEHVWEHLSEQDACIAAENCFNLLKSGGYLRIAVPDGFHYDIDYINDVKPGGKGAGSDDHKVLYNYQSLSNIFSSVGFNVKILEWFDEEREFHFESWSKSDGLISRSTRYDERNKNNPTQYTSLIIDAIKP